jgi:hypothetical protein
MTSRTVALSKLLIGTLTLVLAGCFPEKPVKVSATPAAPQPVASKTPDDIPISYVQNVGVLPPEQAIPAGALSVEPQPQIAEHKNAGDNETTPRRRTASQNSTAPEARGIACYARRDRATSDSSNQPAGSRCCADRRRRSRSLAAAGG